MQQTLNIIKSSFESWYNKTFSANISVAINYSDIQTLAIKAFHTVNIDVVILSTVGGKPSVVPIITLKENYNHGEITEEEMQIKMSEKLLIEIYNYCINNTK